MYAVFRSGGKQYRASKGERLKLEKLDADEGASIRFDEVLLVGEGTDIKVGSPLLSGTSIGAKVLRQGKSGKVSVTKFRRRQNYLRQHTHRQWFTEVEITSIGGDAGDVTADPDVDQTSSKPAAKNSKAKKTSKKSGTAKKASAASSGKKTTSKKSSSKKAAKKKASGEDE